MFCKTTVVGSRKGMLYEKTMVGSRKACSVKQLWLGQVRHVL